MKVKSKSKLMVIHLPVDIMHLR